jgi:hypothetical protein
MNHSWWQVSPSFVAESLKLFGFPDIKCEHHYQKFNGTSADLNSRMVKHFTLTARRAQPLEAGELEKIQMTYISGFYEPECTYKHVWRWSSGPHWYHRMRIQRIKCDKHVWRWSPGPHAEILISNLGSQNLVVSLSFGLSSITSDATLKVLVNGQLAWEGGSFYGIKPVFIAAVVFVPGRNTVEITSTGHPVGPTAKDKRILSYTLYDFKICRPAFSSES